MNTATKLQTTATIHHLPVTGEKQLSIEGFMELPEQPIPDDCDLRNFRYMPFDVQRFIDSKFATTVDPASGFFAIQLWAKAWHQLPAGSLPNDDDQLRSLSGCGRDTRLWQSVRAGALYGWVLHSDGRLYHKALTEFVLEAYDKLLINREKGKKGGRPRKDNGNTDAIHQDNTEKATENPQLYNGKAAVNQEKGREEKREEDILSDDADNSPPDGGERVPENLDLAEIQEPPPENQSPVEKNFDLLWDSGLPKVKKKAAFEAFRKLCGKRNAASIEKNTQVLLEDIREKLEFIGDRDSPFSRTHLATYVNGRMWEEPVDSIQIFDKRSGGNS